MNKLNKLILLIVIITAILLVFYAIYRKGLADALKGMDTNLNKEVLESYNSQNYLEELNKFTEEDMFRFTDYPLIEIPFINLDSWIVINRINLFTEEEKYKYIKDVNVLESYKDSMHVTTYPVGRGTTPTGIIYVYKDNYLIKEIPYIEIYFDSEDLLESFEDTTVDKLYNMFDINCHL